MIYKCKVSAFLVVLLSASAFAQETMKLSLAEALQTAVKRNLDVRLERVAVDSSAISLDLTRAAFEPTFTNTTSTSSADRESTSVIDGGAGASYSVTQTSTDATYRKEENFGLSWNVNGSADVSDSTSANSLGETWSTNLSIGFTQKLFKGFMGGEEVRRYDEFVAKADVEISEIDLENRIIGILEQVENAYWDLVSAKEQLAVDQTSLELAKRLYEQNKIKIKVGTLAPIELKDTEAEIASRESVIVTSENRVLAAEDTLKKILNLPVKDWGKSIETTDSIIIKEIDANLQEDYQTALNHRAEVRKNKKEFEKAMLTNRLRKNEMLPEINLRGGFQSRGVSSPTSLTQENPLYDPELPESQSNPKFISTGIEGATFLDASSKTINGDLPGWSLSVDVTWNPFNKAAKLRKAQAEIGIRRQELVAEQTNLTVMEDVRSAIRELNSNMKSINASEKTVKFRSENLKAEEQKFQNGLSTNYFVAEKQKDLAAAESDLIQSKINYLKAVVSYYKAMGRLTKERNITVE